MNKRTALTMCAVALAICTLGLTTIFSNNENNYAYPSMVSGDGTYQFTLNNSNSIAGASKNMTVGDGVTYTSSNNPVYWEYLYGYTNSDFITLDEGGYLTNTSDILGLSKISVTASEDIKYISNEEEITITNGDEITLEPTNSFTLLSLTDGTSITSITVKYACSSISNLYTHEYDDVNDEYTITAVNNKSLSTYVVPSKHNNKPVIMGEDIFVGCNSMVSLYIPSLNGSTFKYYFNNDDYNIPTTIRNVIVKSGDIPASAFKYSTRAYSITNITLLDSSSIGSRAFDSLTSLANVYLNDGLTTISQYAFQYDPITTIFIPSSVTSVEKQVFQNCSNLSTIRCGAAEQPDGWSNSWKTGCDALVSWGQTR